MDRLHVLRGVVDEVLPHRAADRAVGLRDVPAHSASRGLHDLAAAERARAIVLGSTHHGPVGRVAVGTTAARLLVKAPCSRGRRSDGLLRARPAALREGGGGRGRLSRLPGRPSRGDVAHLGARRKPGGAPPWRSPRALSGKQLLADVDSMLERSGAARHRAARAEGRPGGGHRAAAADDFDLLVLGCRNVGGPLGHPTLRSVSRELMHGTGVPVIVVPEQVPVDGRTRRLWSDFHRRVLEGCAHAARNVRGDYGARSARTPMTGEADRP